MHIETITLAEANTRHPACFIDVIDRSDAEGDARPAIYVWSSEEEAENDPGARAIALYWLAEPASVA